jgi:chaperonin cofactor prefoldin
MEKDHLEILLEDNRSKFDPVLEGHAALDKKIDTRFDELNEKIELNSFKIDTLNKKIDTVDERLGKKIDDMAANLSAHRKDTEAHGTVYRVKED